MAIQASDFAIGEFKFLRRLLLFHGRTNYIRIVDLIYYFFYKNFVFSITHFYYGFFNNFSGQTIIDDWLISCYNLIFTAFPLGARAALDHDIHPKDGQVAEIFQSFLYDDLKKNPIFTFKYFIFNLLRGIFHGLINFFFLYLTLRNNQIDGDGNIADMWYFSTSCYTNIIFVN
jgi:magnesium-transporting ATPase (P-type)